VNVIVGPNAIGKTTLLEAIRLAKALLAPRSQRETQQALFSLGAAVNYNPQRLIPSAIFRDLRESLEINCRFEFWPDELATLESSIPQIATDLVLRRAGQSFSAPASSVTFLSSAPGRAALRETEAEMQKSLDEIRSSRQTCRLHLVVDPVSRRFTGDDPYGAAFFAFLENNLPPNPNGVQLLSS